jgi:alpha-D-xyloside xylohydrolase
MPYIYSLAGHSYFDNYTIMRGLIMDFHADNKVYEIADQYMFGPSLLINPVYAYKARTRDVYLPSTTGWYDFYTGAYLTGGQTVKAVAPLDRIPVYVKEGSIIPVGPEIQYTTEKPADPLTLYVYTGKDASFTLYEDENINYNYEQGKYTSIPFTYNEATKTLTIGERQGSFNGMLEKRTINIVWITKDHGAAIAATTKADQVVTYDGKTLTVEHK